MRRSTLYFGITLFVLSGMVIGIMASPNDLDPDRVEYHNYTLQGPFTFSVPNKSGFPYELMFLTSILGIRKIDSKEVE